MIEMMRSDGMMYDGKLEPCEEVDLTTTKRYPHNSGDQESQATATCKSA